MLAGFEAKFGDLLPRMKWVNFGGGHHITRADYDVDGLVALLLDFRQRYPHLTVYLEPGEAEFDWQMTDNDEFSGLSIQQIREKLTYK